MPKSNNKVETLRALLITAEQVDEFITNLKDIGEFTVDDKVLMESFLRIYQQGTNQLKKFIDLLDEKGDDVDEYTILYYTRQLSLGPLSQAVGELTADKSFWKKTPDILGVNSNLNKSVIQTPLKYSETDLSYKLIDNIVVLNKLPGFVFNNLHRLVGITSSMTDLAFVNSLALESELYPNKNAQSRFDTEDKGTLNQTAHGFYLVSDSDSWTMTKDASTQIVESLKSYLEDRDYRLYVFKKTYNPFNKEDNLSETPANTVVEHKLVYKESDPATGKLVDKSIIIKTDLNGCVFDGDEVRKFSIKIPNKSKDKELKLHTVQGQLGGVNELKKSAL